MSTQKGTSKRKYVACVEDGELPKLPTGSPETMVFKIHNFASREQGRYEPIFTEAAQAHGYNWKLCLYPRGKEQSNVEKEYVAVFLCSANDRDVEASFCLRCSGSSAKCGKHVYKDNYRKGFHNWKKRSHILDPQKDYLDANGTLTIEVDLEIYVEKKPVWYPKLLMNCPILPALYMNEKESDVTFFIEGEEFLAHRCIVAERSPTLYEMVTEASDGRIEIGNMESWVFKVILRYIYTVFDPENEVDTWNDIEKTKVVLLAADQFECTGLKLHAESVLVDKHLNTETVAGLLLFADGHSCALLKEATMRCYYNNSAVVRKSNDWPLVVKSNALLDELLQMRDEHGDQGEGIDSLDVITLRERLDAAKLELDGCKEVLVKRLKDHEEVKISATKD